MKRPTEDRRHRRWLVRGVVLSVAMGGLLLALRVLESWLIFHPTRYPDGDWNPVGLDFEDVKFLSGNGVRLHAWYCRHPHPQAVILWCHGNAGNLSYRGPIIRFFQQHLDVDVLIFDYRGYGHSEGRPTEEGLYADARAAYDWLRRHKEIEPERLILLGRSLGAAVATQLALEKPHRALILESPFTSVPDMGRSLLGLPVGWFLRHRFDTAAKLAQYKGPVLITHGTRDTIVPFEMGRRLFERAPGPKSFYAIEGADHNDTDLIGGERYLEAIRQFLDQWLPSNRDGPLSKPVKESVLRSEAND